MIFARIKHKFILTFKFLKIIKGIKSEEKSQNMFKSLSALSPDNNHFSSSHKSLLIKNNDTSASTTHENKVNTKQNETANMTESSMMNSVSNNNILSSNLSIERQESKDSGFWTISKCSFESMKSLSISDTPAIAAAAAAAHFFQQQQQKQLQQHQSNNNNNETLNSSNQQQSKSSQSTENNNEINNNSRKFLDAADVLSKSQLSNWKKWKKGQAWRYNSSNNISESDNNINNNDLNYNNNHNNNGQNKNELTYNITNTSSNSFDFTYNRSFDSTSCCSNNSDSCSTNRNYLQKHIPHMSNSFELSTIGSYNSPCSPALSTTSHQSTAAKSPSPVNHLHQNSYHHHHHNHNYHHHAHPLHTWSSTSILETTNNTQTESLNKSLDLSSSGSNPGNSNQMILAAKGQKRRGKLVRDRTIDNADETSPYNNNLSTNRSNDRINAFSPSPVSMIDSSTSNNNHNNSNNNNNNNSNDANLDENNSSDNKSLVKNNNGRISPPEKRASFSFDQSSSNSNSNSANISIDNDNMICTSSTLTTTTTTNNNLFRQYSINNLASGGSIKTGMSGCGISRASSNDSSSKSPSPSPSSIYSTNSNNTLVHGNSPSNNTILNNSSFDSSNSQMHYDFYKDLQSKLNIKTNDSNESSSTDNNNQRRHNKYLSTKNYNKHLNHQQQNIYHLNVNLSKDYLDMKKKSTSSSNFLDHNNNNNNQNHSALSPSLIMNNTLSASMSNFLPYTKQQQDTSMLSSPGQNINNRSPPPQQNNEDSSSNNNNNNNNNNHSTNTTKIVCRSNSSPSYSAATLQQIQMNLNNSPKKTTNKNNNQDEQMDSSSYQNNTNCSNKLTITTHMPSFSFNNSRSPSTNSLPLTPTPQHITPSFFNNNNNNNSNSINNNNSTSPFMPVVQPSANSSSSTILYELNSYYNTMKYEKLLANAANTLSTPSARPQGNLLIKPPEIVITESKSENEQIDYDNYNSNLKKQDDSNTTTNQQMTNMKYLKEKNNVFSAANFLAKHDDLIKHSVNNNNNSNNDQNQNNDKVFNFFKNSLTSYDSLFKPCTLLGGNNSNSSFRTNASHQIDPNNLNVFDSWKSANPNPILNLNSKKAINNNASNSNLNSNNNSINNNSNNKLAPSKTNKPHICVSCQKRFARLIFFSNLFYF